MTTALQELENQLIANRLSTRIANSASNVEIRNILNLLISKDYRNIEIALMILKNNSDLLNCFNQNDKNLLDEVISRNYTTQYFCIHYDFKLLINNNKIETSLFYDLKRDLPSEIYDDSSATKYNILKLFIQSLRNIESIDIRRQKLKKLPEEIYDCSNLKALKICSNPISTFSARIKELKQLQSLCFCGIEAPFHISKEILDMKNTLKEICVEKYRFKEKYIGVSSFEELEKLLPFTTFLCH
jgi:hypothetical protein